MVKGVLKEKEKKETSNPTSSFLWFTKKLIFASLLKSDSLCLNLELNSDSSINLCLSS